MAVLVFTSLSIKAQLPLLSSGVYTVDKTAASDSANQRLKSGGSTTDLALLSVHASTLAPGKTNHPPRALADREEIIIVTEGKLTININDSSKAVGPGSIALIMAGDTQSFQNTSDAPVTYFVFGFKAMLPVDLSQGKGSGGSLIKDWNSLPVTKTGKGESRPVFDRPTSMFTRLELHATTLNSLQESHPPHTHRAEEIMFLLRGNITMNMAGEKLKAAPGSIMLLRPDVLHNVTNTGDEVCTYIAMKWYN